LKALLDTLETRFGRFAVPGCIQLIATLQLVALVVFALLPPDTRQPYEDFLKLDPAKVLDGQVWRLLTFTVIPASNLFFAVITVLFLMWLGRGLDEAWGAFRVNAYVLGGMLAITLGTLLFGYAADGYWLQMSLLFAFATIYPNEEILLFFVLPVKIKWVAIFSAAMLGLMVVSSPVALIPIFFAVLNYALVFAPGFVRGRLHAARIAGRHARYAEAVGGAAEFFHQCQRCGKTEVDDPSLHFRVTDEGDEICSACRQ
jgi:hypothetical protein